MAELDFSHNVSEIPAGQTLPHPYQRNSEPSQGFNAPNFQNAINSYAENTNWMSSVGSSVASHASNAIAQKIGGELGKNPQGDIGYPATDFDKTMQESYKSQANATLGLQANQLISDSNIEAAKSSRVTPELIAKTNHSIAMGLKNIIKNAPSEIRPNLESHYGTLQINQMADLTERMLKEQHEDRRNNTALSSQKNAENAYSFGLHGNDKAAQNAIETVRKISYSDVASRLLTPEAAKENIDTARKSFLNGKIIHDYEIARSQGKGEEYLKSISNKKPSYLNDKDYMSVTNNLMTYVNHQDALRSQDQQLRLTKFQTSVALNPMAPDMQQQLQNLKSNVSHESYERAKLHYIDAVKSFNVEQENINNALTGWNNPSAFARLTDKGINKAFDMQVQSYVEQRQKEGNPISLDEAEVQVAASAGGKVSVFQDSLENKLLRGSPQDILSASNQMQMLNHIGQSRVYDGVSQKAKAIATLFQQQRGSMPDNDLARKITDDLANVDEKTQKILDNSWNLVLSSKGAAGVNSSKPLYRMALNEVGLTKGKDVSSVGGQYFATIYGNDIYNQLNSNFIATRGDYAAAKKMTQDYVDTHYSDTYVNGSRQKTNESVEKYLGYKGNDVTPYIQQDLLNQLSSHFIEAKKNSPNDYWETAPLKNGVAEAIRTVNGKKYSYPINIIGRGDNQWDVVVQTPYGIRNLFLVAPHVGVTTYKPNKEAIDKIYKARK